MDIFLKNHNNKQLNFEKQWLSYACAHYIDVTIYSIYYLHMAYNSQYHQLFKAKEHSPVPSNCCTSSSNLTGIEYMKSIVSNVDLHEKDW